MRETAGKVAARAARLAALVLALVAVAAGSAWAAMYGKQFLFTSPLFALKTIRFEGVHRASQLELQRLGGIAIGDNIFQADVLGAEKAMATHAWVRRVSLEREYPHTLVARVIEHAPAALADLGGLYYLDEEGKAFKKLGAGEDGDFPIFTGLSRDEYLASAEEWEGLFREGLAALRAYRSAGLEAKAPISEVQVDKAEGLTVLVGKDAVAVKLGFEGYGDKFTRLDQLLTELARRGARAEVIRLDNRARPGWVAVQLAQGGSEVGQQQ